MRSELSDKRGFNRVDAEEIVVDAASRLGLSFNPACCKPPGGTGGMAACDLKIGPAITLRFVGIGRQSIFFGFFPGNNFFLETNRIMRARKAPKPKNTHVNIPASSFFKRLNRSGANA